MKLIKRSLGAFALLVALGMYAHAASDTLTTVTAQAPKKWYDSFSIRGYTQVRYNRLLETNPNLSCEQCDRSWGKNSGFSFRRIRIIFSGQIGERIFFYIQPDFASSPSSTNLNFAQIRDAYFDVGLDKQNEFRFRIGQSKVPFGFENMQSSQNRLPLDRNDALNSAFSNERDLGVFFYWAPESKRKLLASLVKDGLKGSGDYGVFGLGVFNGQTANRPEQNNTQHVVARVAYPFEAGGQIFEAGLQGYTGNFVIPKEQISADVRVNPTRSYLDQRGAATFVLYPKPFGIQAEYNIGRGPEFSKETNSIETKKLRGGYSTFSYMTSINDQVLIPFVRIQYYKGGKKHELDARSYKVNEFEIGAEWQPMKQLEFVTMYTLSSRRYEDAVLRNNFQKGNLLRIQAQLNF